MTQVQINGSDGNTLHVLHLDLPPEAIDRFTKMAGTGEWPLKYGLGAKRLREGFVDVVSIRDLAEMPLTHYLASAYDVSTRALGPDKTRLDALKGHVVVLPPQAFDATSQTLTIASPLTLIGSYAEARPAPKGPKLKSRAAHGQGAGGAPAGGGSLGNSVLLKIVLAALALILALVLWLALI